MFASIHSLVYHILSMPHPLSSATIRKITESLAPVVAQSHTRSRPIYPFSYYGGKTQHARWIIEHLPLTDTYIEPFGGAASVLLQRHPVKTEVYCDLSAPLVNFFRVLQTNLEELLDSLALTPHSRLERRLCHETSTSPVEAARRYYVLCTQSFNSRQMIDDSWSFATKPGSQSHWKKYEIGRYRLRAVARRIADVELIQGDGIEVLKAYDDKKAVFYADPPYPAEARRQTTSYRHETDDDLHRRLAEVAKSIEGYIAISGYRCDLYDTLFADFYRYDQRPKRAQSAAHSKQLDKEQQLRVESLWCNYQVGLGL